MHLMFLITGYSDSRNGIAVVIGADNRDEALQKLAYNWNSQFEDKMKLVITDGGQEYLINEGFDSDVVNYFNDFIPGSEGFSLEVTIMTEGQINANMPW